MGITILASTIYSMVEIYENGYETVGSKWVELPFLKSAQNLNWFSNVNASFNDFLKEWQRPKKVW